MENKYKCINRIVFCFVIFLFIIIPINSAVSYDEQSAMEISSISTGPGGFIIGLSNTGETYIRGVTIMVNVTGGWIKPIDFHYEDLLFSCNCTDVFQPGDTYNIYTSTNESFFSFGFIDLSVYVSSYPIESISVERRAFIFGPFILLFS